MKKVIYAKLNKSDDKGKRFLSFDKATLKDLGIAVAGTICARYCRGIGSNNDGLVIEVSE